MACQGRGEEAGKNRTEAKTGGSKKQSELQEVVPSMFGFGDEKEVTSLHLSLFCLQFIVLIQLGDKEDVTFLHPVYFCM